ncbi:MAG: UDP-2,3-diacylglucosamine diphosphatase LpxI [Candidatus Omnitrophica bacterium]|nr:UDP-2,3-diacylglucosamine diphosphatase LpxI [Candidatus Omnitrophota bacterium]
MKEKIGLIAGGGDLPFEFLKSAKLKKKEIIIFSILNETNKGIEKFGFLTYWVSILELSKIIRLIKKENIKKIIFLGYIKHTNLLKNIKFDFLTLKLLAKLKDKRASTIMKAIIDEFKKNNIKILPSTYCLEHLLPDKGFLGKKKFDDKTLKDIEFGYKIAKKIADCDIGQTIVIKNRIVVAVEAQEGTDMCIKRGAKIAGKNFIVIKAARTSQDLRYDVPVIGEKTLKLIKESGGAGLVVEAKKTLILNKNETIKKADKLNLFVYAI